MKSAVAIDRLRPGDHVCWTFDDDADVIETMQRFVTDGITTGDQVHCLVATETDELRAGLQEHGIDTEAVEAQEQLHLDSAERSYLASGGFVPDDVLTGWKSELSKARDGGYGLRVIADMSWACDAATGPGQLSWYEAQASRLFAHGYSTVVCLYDERRLAPDELDEIAMSHSACTMGLVDGLPWPQLHVERQPQASVLRLSGEADLATRHALETVLSGLAEDLPSGSSPITVDVSELAFADGATARALVRAAEAAPSGLRIIGASAAMAKLIELVGGGHTTGLTVSRANDSDLSDGGGDH